MTETLPLHARHLAAGAELHATGGRLRPAHYGAAAAEERLLIDAVGLSDRSDTERIAVTGADRVSFLQGMLTNDVAAIAPGAGCRAAWLNAKARVQMLLEVLVLDDRVELLLPPGHAEPFAAGLDRFVIMEDVAFAPVAAAGTLALEGPRAATVAAAATGLDAALLEGMATPPGDLRHVAVDLDGVSVRVVALSAGPAGGLRLLTEGDASARALWDRLVAAGEPHGLHPIGDAAFEVARVAGGTLVYGLDVDAESFMPELPRDAFVSFQKGCYLGQEPVARVHFRGRPVRQLAGLAFAEGATPPPPRAPLRATGPDGDKDAGFVASAAWSTRLGRALGLGFVRQEYLEPGTPLATATDGEPVATEVRALPIAD